MSTLLVTRPKQPSIKGGALCQCWLTKDGCENGVVRYNIGACKASWAKS